MGVQHQRTSGRPQWQSHCIPWLCLVCGTKPWGGSLEALQLAGLWGNTSPSSPVLSCCRSSSRSPESGQAGQKFPVKVKHFMSQAHKMKPYHCSYQVLYVFYFSAAPTFVGSSASSMAGALQALGAGPCWRWRPHPRDAEVVPLQQHVTELSTVVLGAEGTAAAGW